MAPTGNGLKIVRTWTNHGAPTGEGGRYLLENGTTWRDVLHVEASPPTGVSYGDIVGNRIVPRQR